MIPKLHNLSKPADLADNRYLGSRLSQPVLADLMSLGEFALTRRCNNVYGILDRNVVFRTKQEKEKLKARRERGKKIEGIRR